jgi:tetratricopeptide (TPR) repeat protein
MRCCRPAGLLRVSMVLALTSWLGACGLVSGLTGEPEATLADLPPVALPREQEELPRVSLAELATIYRDVLRVSQDPATRLQVQHRLADIEMLDGEAGLAHSAGDAGDGEAFARAIAAYQALVRDNPDNPRNDQLLYQLSKAYELSGDNAGSLAVLEQLSAGYPDSQHYLEARFRRAESYFVAARYRAAELAYADIIDAGQGTPYYLNSLYMQGWARFKQARYGASIAPFTATLDQLLQADKRLDTLPRGEAELAQDCLRVLAVVFSNLEGAETIASAYDQLGVLSYQHLFYQALGDLYLAQNRYRDSAETYRAYNRRFPDSKVAHQMQLRVIDSYEAGGFPQLIVQAKQHYVELFGVSTAYWMHSTEETRDAIRPELQLYIGELASYHHAQAQQATSNQRRPELALRHYRRAGEYYRMYIDSFPQTVEVPAMGFLLAETLYEVADYADAIQTYEWVAYSYADHERAPDAAYAAILAYEQLLPANPSEVQLALQQQRIDSELAFATAFSSDARAPAVLNQAAVTLVELADYQRAIIAAATLVNWHPPLGDDLSVSAQLVMGHSHFELQQYASAEQAYQSALARMPLTDSRYPGAVDSLAASAYRQAEQAVAVDGSLQAAQLFERVTALAPASAISVNAQYDAAMNYMRAGELARANQLFIAFRDNYPRHDLSTGVGAILVGNYEQLQQWGAAAMELDTLHATQTDSEAQRQALYLAAQYYDRAQQRQLAIERYRSYAHGWPQPLAIRMEATSRLAQLYEANADEQKRDFWLRQTVAAHDGAGERQSERSLYLAALASSILADARYRDYTAITLQYPLKQSLQHKRAAMQQTLAAYNKINEYAVQQFSTLASYRMAQVYRQLSSDLMSSERPKNINALALEQYQLMLEEQAYPFEEKAIAIHEANARRSWEGIYDEWVRESFVALADLLPARYRKLESGADFGRASGAQPHQAESVFEQNIASTPQDPLLYNQYGVFLRQQGRFQEAEEVYMDALRVDDSYADSHRNIGILYDLYRGDSERALQHYYNYQQLVEENDRVVAGWIADLERRSTMLVKGG